MSVTNYGNSFTMTAGSDERTGVVFLRSIMLAGSGMAAGEHLKITDSSGGVLVDHYIENTYENKEFVVRRMITQGVKLNTVPTTGVWSVTVGLE